MRSDRLQAQITAGVIVLSAKEAQAIKGGRLAVPQTIYWPIDGLDPPVPPVLSPWPIPPYL